MNLRGAFRPDRFRRDKGGPGLLSRIGSAQAAPFDRLRSSEEVGRDKTILANDDAAHSFPQEGARSSDHYARPLGNGALGALIVQVGEALPGH